MKIEIADKIYNDYSVSIIINGEETNIKELIENMQAKLTNDVSINTIHFEPDGIKYSGNFKEGKM